MLQYNHTPYYLTTTLILHTPQHHSTFLSKQTQPRRRRRRHVFQPPDLSVSIHPPLLSPLSVSLPPVPPIEDHDTASWCTTFLSEAVVKSRLCLRHIGAKVHK